MLSHPPKFCAEFHATKSRSSINFCMVNTSLGLMKPNDFSEREREIKRERGRKKERERKKDERERKREREREKERERERER